MRQKLLKHETETAILNFNEEHRRKRTSGLLVLLQVRVLFFLWGVKGVAQNITIIINLKTWLIAVNPQDECRVDWQLLSSLEGD